MDPEEMLCELNRAIGARNIPTTDRDRLRALARTPGMSSTFSAELAKVFAAAPAHDRLTEPDAYEANANNPALPRVMHACGITAQNVRDHGPRGVLCSRDGSIVPNLRELSDATIARGE